MRGIKRKGSLLAGGAIVAAALFVAALAQAEIGKTGDILITFSGGITPGKLPRTTLSPVTVLMGAKIKTTSKEAEASIPELKKMVLDINSHGKIEPDGLPVCSEGKLNSISAQGALHACGRALVGHGNVTTRITLPKNPTFASTGGLLAFNGRIHGRPAVLAQVTAGAPLPLTFVIAFEVKKLHGKFGTALVGTVPPIASGYGKISAINLSLRRIYHSHGRQASFVSADCPAPSGFTAATFTFAKVTFSFSDGRSVDTTMERNCKVR